MLTLVGLGLRDGDIPVRGIDALEEADAAYAELYTNTIDYDLAALGERTGTDITVLDRAAVEDEDRIVETAADQDVVFLVSGDPLAATTHQDLLFRARRRGLDVEVVHAPSILTAVAQTGLSLYKFGRTTTLTIQNGAVPGSVFDAVRENQAAGLHTLVLLDIGMTVDEALPLLAAEVSGDVVVCDRVGTADQQIAVGEIDEIAADRFGTPAAVIVPGELSGNEQERLQHV
ncbi:MAG: diphthine synthase [Candidatus Nanohaloarchaea archaeon]|nr:diphthine synthase [Candidatus Nanohaloarchaea archaeon]